MLEPRGGMPISSNSKSTRSFKRGEENAMQQIYMVAVNVSK